jgi:multiple sugar transport system substrate-binding protein
VPFDDYEGELLNAFANQTAPDIFMIHNSWLPKYQDKVAAIPAGEQYMTYRQYEEAFPDVVATDFTRNRAEIYAAPLYLDTLALYYNRDLLNAAGYVQPPASWEAFQEVVQRLTLVDANGNLVRPGAALGTARNVNRSTDIFSLLLLQTFGGIDVQPIDPAMRTAQLTYSRREGAEVFSPGQDALRFYTDFANPVLKEYTWNRNQSYSIDAFVAGQVAMMFNYSHHIETIRARAPELNFNVARAPQPQGMLDQQKAIDYPSYFGLAVSRFGTRQEQEAAWEFLMHLSKPQTQQQYSQLTKRPPAHRQALATLLEHPDYRVFAQQALTAKSWYQPNSTLMETYFADMIESVIDGVSVREALDRAQGQVNVLLRREEDMAEPAQGIL